VVISAARLASAGGAPWSIIHVLESASLRNRQRVLHYRTGEELDVSDGYRAEVRRQLRRSYRDLLAWAPPCEVTTSTGFPWEEIGRQASLREADLIIMGPHAGIGDKKGALKALGGIGSTVEGVIAHARCPVMIVGRHPCRPKPTFKRLLVGIDFSVSCECALRFAAALARYHGARIDIFHMLPVPPFPKYARRDYDADLARTRRRMASFGAKYLGALEHRYHLWGGALPFRELFQCAHQCQSDALILGSHTKEAHGKWYAGSTVEQISLQATCPVFVLTDARALRPWLPKYRPEDALAAPGDHTIQVFGKGEMEKML
jgi:nucleotide-binding universal stress UspA family protein